MKRLISVLLCMTILFSFPVISRSYDDKMARIDALRLIIDSVGYDKKAEENVTECPFSEVKEEDKIYVGYAYYKKLTNGTEADKFSPDCDITREEFLIMVLRLLGYPDRAFADNIYERAEISRIYPVRYEGAFTRSEAKDILAKAFFACYYQNGSRFYDYTVPGEEIEPLVKKEKENISPYMTALSSVSSQIGTIKYRNELPKCSIIFGYITGTPHGSSASGCVIYKEDGKSIKIKLPMTNIWVSSMPDEIWLDEEQTELYYTYEAEEIADGGRVIQEAGNFECSFNLETGETKITKK